MKRILCHCIYIYVEIIQSYSDIVFSSVFNIYTVIIQSVILGLLWWLRAIQFRTQRLGLQWGVKMINEQTAALKHRWTCLRIYSVCITGLWLCMTFSCFFFYLSNGWFLIWCIHFVNKNNCVSQYSMSNTHKQRKIYCILNVYFHCRLHWTRVWKKKCPFLLYELDH